MMMKRRLVYQDFTKTCSWPCSTLCFFLEEKTQHGVPFLFRQPALCWWLTQFDEIVLFENCFVVFAHVVVCDPIAKLQFSCSWGGWGGGVGWGGDDDVRCMCTHVRCYGTVLLHICFTCFMKFTVKMKPRRILHEKTQRFLRGWWPTEEGVYINKEQRLIDVAVIWTWKEDVLLMKWKFSLIIFQFCNIEIAIPLAEMMKCLRIEQITRFLLLWICLSKSTWQENPVRAANSSEHWKTPTFQNTRLTNADVTLFFAKEYCSTHFVSNHSIFHQKHWTEPEIKNLPFFFPVSFWKRGKPSNHHQPTTCISSTTPPIFSRGQLPRLEVSLTLTIFQMQILQSKVGGFATKMRHFGAISMKWWYVSKIHWDE